MESDNHGYSDIDNQNDVIENDNDLVDDTLNENQDHIDDNDEENEETDYFPEEFEENDINNDNTVKQVVRPVSYLGLWLAISFLFAGITLQFIDYSKRIKRQSCNDSPLRKVDQTLTINDYIEAIKYDLSKYFPKTSPIKDSYVDTKEIDRIKKLPPIIFNITTNIQNIKGKNLTSAINTCINNKKPVKITYIPEVKSWNALKWDYWSLSTVVGWLDHVLSIPYESVTNIFLIGTENDNLYMYPSTKPAQSHANFPFFEFLNNIKKLNRYYFYSGNYRLFEKFGQLENDTNWKKFRYIEEITKNTNITVNDTDPNLSLMYPNTALQARYSEYHTFRVQLHGTGVYYIIPPSLGRYLYTYPYIHASVYQAQVDFYDRKIQNKLYSRSNRVVLEQVKLKPGEVLYIPPYHYVHSEAHETLNAMLDILSPSLEQLILYEGGHVQARFQNITSFEERVVIAQIYIVHILSRVQGVKSPKQFANSLYLNRYSSLFPIDSLFLQKEEQNFDCFADQPEITQKLLSKISTDTITSIAQHVADCLNDPAISSDIKWLYLGNYIESVAKWAMGNADLTVVFIRKCLDFDKKLDIVVEVEGPPVIKIT